MVSLPVNSGFVLKLDFWGKKIKDKIKYKVNKSSEKH